MTECEQAGGERCPTGEEALRTALRKSAPLPLDIRVDGAPLADDLVMLEVMNIELTGPRLPFAPDARPGDGMLHISWLPASKRAAMMRWLGRERRSAGGAAASAARSRSAAAAR